MVLIWIGFAVVTAIAAGKHERSVPLWSVLGFFFGPFALVAVLIMGREAPARGGD